MGDVRLLVVKAMILTACWSMCCANDCQCKFPKHKNRSEELEKLIGPLCGRRFTAQDDSNEYVFTVGICTTALINPEPLELTAAVIQTNNKNNDHAQFVIGSLTSTEIMAGTNWILLEYEGGGNYHTSCNNENKRTNIMITCNPAEKQGKLRWIEENHNKSGDCYYLFELEHNVACLDNVGTQLGVGSILCIFIACTVTIYLVGGILFMRLCRQAKGYHQIPNYSFWQDFGALQADGCDLVCRCRPQMFDTKGSYHGIGDHQIECATDTTEEFDDHLLPM